MKDTGFYHVDTRATGVKGLVFRAYRLLVLPLVLGLAEQITCSTFDHVMNSGTGGYCDRHPGKFSNARKTWVLREERRRERDDDRGQPDRLPHLRQ